MGEATAVLLVGEIWQLLKKGEVVGEIVIEDADFPWLSGRFLPAPGFAAVKPLFDRELVLVEEEEMDEWEAVTDEIRRTLELAAPAGPVAEFLLQVDGDRAWFRWSDEPFE
ncbi:hypothetical protein [Streptomyces sp. BE303]|uniref:hypothetical protein n=1 Tax=Streptomyces sp. BE303 TaxID=3002528 RepID=UPI003FA6FDB6